MDWSLIKDLVLKVLRMAAMIGGSTVFGYLQSVPEQQLGEVISGAVALVGFIASWVTWARRRKQQQKS